MTSRSNATASETRHDPINAILDLWEAQTLLLLDHGAEGPLRERLKRLLPSREPERLPAAAGPVSADDELRFITLKAACARSKKFRWPALAHEAVARIEGEADARLAAAKAQRATSNARAA